MDSINLNIKLQKARQLMQQRQYAEALDLYAKLTHEEPQTAYEYGRAAAHSGDFDLAIHIWERKRHLAPKDADNLARLAAECAKIGLHLQSRELFSEAASLEPGNLELQVKLAWLLSRTNGVEEARVAVNRCIALDRKCEQVRYLAALCDRRESNFSGAEEQLRDLLVKGVHQTNIRYSCHAELAYILDRTGRFDEAMAQLEEGKKLARQDFKLEAERKVFYERQEIEIGKTRALPKNILREWSKSFLAEARTPVVPLCFLSGSARSGTTLLEKILDAHPEVAACDESLAFQKIQPQIDFFAPALSAGQIDLWRQRYLKNLAHTSGTSGNGKILLDKNPGRTLWLPAFLRVFPELKVLIALRDPRDIIISLYFQDHPNTNYLTFEQLAHRYAAVMDVWLAVREWEGLSWLETRYEDVVLDLRKEGERVTQFLGIEWHKNQLRFYESNRDKPILSTNYGDVTKPLYARSIGRWHSYEKHLTAALPVLESYLTRFGYE